MKKILPVIIAVVIVILMVIVIVTKLNNKLSNETDELAAIEGIVLEVSEKSILINEVGYKNGECYLIVGNNTEIYIGDDKADISSIEVGRTIKAIYSGGREESYPSKINEVIKITVE